mmetsp:Transcript_76852/g.172416  ORF Transcript_76852/g.172416 Transcript_76852/m.172416 type:complete len:492 (-) Transcript_76852:110-1585(-)
MATLPSKPKKIAITCIGSRGDCQPYIAVALGLQDAGYQVLILTGENHTSFCAEFGIPMVPCFTDAEEVLRQGKGLEAMCKGDVPTFVEVLTEQTKLNAERFVTEWSAGIKAFGPDLHITGSLSEYFGTMSNNVLKIPSFVVKLQCIVLDAKRMCFGLPNLPFGLNSLVIKQALMKPQYKMCDEFQEPFCERIHGKKAFENYKFKHMVEEARGRCPYPVLVGQGKVLADVLYPEAPSNVEFVGQFVLPATVQERHAKMKDSKFGGGDTIKLLEEFFKSGTKPIYMGWGSMIGGSPKYMCEFLARAVKLSGQRAIVLGGWAKLSMELLQTATEDKEVIEYATKNILFVTAAPHEWLFPKCACTVTHAGAGTMGTCLRAGGPTIVTPIFLDQYDHAYVVNKLGCGVGFTQQFLKISPEAVADAIKKCVTDQDIQSKAKEVAAKIHSQDTGVPAVLKRIDKFWDEQVLTGQLFKAIENRGKEPKETLCQSLSICR